MLRSRTPAQWFCLFGGAVLLLRGIVGFAFLDASFGSPGEGWHHLIHLVSGGVLMAAGATAAPARGAAVAFGAFYLGVAVTGIVDGNDVLGLIAADTADKIFHTLLGVTALAAGAASPGSSASARRPSHTRA